MIKKIVLLASVVILGACSISCSDKFTNANEHILNTAQSVYELRLAGEVKADKALLYQSEIENAYKYTSDGSVLCDSNEDAAKDKFEDAEDILNAIDNQLSVNEMQQLVEIKGE